jgi:hypothetical protein
MSEEYEEGGEIDPNDVLHLIPDGRYRVRYEWYETRLGFGKTPKVVLNFVVTTPGDAFGTPLQKYYNVNRLKGGPKRGGGFVPSMKGDLLRNVISLFGEFSRNDRIAIRKLFGRQELEVITRTVVADSKGNELPEECHYSVIDVIVGPAPALSLALSRQTLPAPKPSPNLTQPIPDEIPF